MEIGRYRKNIIYCADEYSVANDVDGIVLLTEWNQFRGMNLDNIKDRMKDNFYFDMRNVYAKDKRVRELFKYYPIGQN
ncbi:UDP-glucose/GDP-mannose dehydrogenase family, UDP binding domain [Fusobacterium varium]|nr:UDP-glucose/GDP-mannose dehydrogenase family, UDP binding domain [Fusobacterium varium]